MHSPLSLRARTLARPLQHHTVPILRPSINMEIIPHLAHLRAAIVQRPLAGGRLVVPRPRAADERRGAVLFTQSFFDVRDGVGGGVGGGDSVGGEPFKGVQAAVVEDDGVEEVDDFFVLDVLGTVAGEVEGGEAGGVFGEFVLFGNSLSISCFFAWGKPVFCNLLPRGLGLESFGRSSICSCTQADRTCQTVRGRCQCRSRCMLGRRCHSVGRWWCLAMALGHTGGSDSSTECTFRR